MWQPLFKGESKSRQSEVRIVQLFLTGSDLNYPKGINVNNIIHTLCPDFSRQPKATFWTRFLSKHFICLCILMSHLCLASVSFLCQFQFSFLRTNGSYDFFFTSSRFPVRRDQCKKVKEPQTLEFFHIVYSKSNCKLSN